MATPRRRTRSMSQSSDEELETGLSLTKTVKRNKTTQALEPIIASPAKSQHEDDDEDSSNDDDNESDDSESHEPKVVEFVDKDELEMKQALKIEKKTKAIAAKKGKKALKKLAERKSYDSDSEQSDIPQDDDLEADDEDNDEEESDIEGDNEDGSTKKKKRDIRSTAALSGGGMADAFTKILSQSLPESTTSTKAPVLAKRKTKLMKEAEEEKLERIKLKELHATRKKIKEVGLHEPDYKDIEHERSLRRVATRGVVALFNAISKHQHTVATEGAPVVSSSSASSSLSTAAKTARDVKQLSKDNFLQMLKAPSQSSSDATNNVSNKISTTESTNSALAGSTVKSSGGGGGAASAWLRDDFMTMGRGKSIKDWERHEEQGGSDNEDEDDSEEDDESIDGEEHQMSDVVADAKAKKKPTNQPKAKSGKKTKGKR